MAAAKRRRTSGGGNGGRRGGADDSAFGVFRPAERHIYIYFDGEKEIAADPMKLYQDLVAYPGLNLAADTKALESSIAEINAPAMRRLVAAVRQAFQVKPFQIVEGNQIGLTDMECLQLLAHWGRFVEDIKKKADPSPISAKPTEPESSDAPSDTPNSSDSTSTEIE